MLLRAACYIRRKLANIGFALTVVAMTTQSAYGADMSLPYAGGHFNSSVVSFKESKFNNVVRQKYDFSCGSAALATLLKYHYGFHAEETEVLHAMYEVGDKEKILREGFSLLDMKAYLASIGYNANGYRTSLDKMQRVGLPAIALINSHGYLHFVVIKGVDEKNVLLGDSAIGMRVMSREDFSAIWNQILFVVSEDKQIARSSFNNSADWKIRETATFDAALEGNILGTFTVDTFPTPNYFRF